MEQILHTISLHKAKRKAKYMFVVILFCSILCLFDFFFTFKQSPLEFSQKKRKEVAEFVPKHFTSPIINYSIPWLDSIGESNFNVTKGSIRRCHKCNFIVRNRKSNSTPRDLIITTMIGNIPNIIPFVRTLRTTGCLATVVFLMDDAAIRKLTAGHINELKDCSVQLINIGKFPYPGRIYGPAMCYIPIADYLYKQSKFIDRVIMSDSYDVVFQGDPFIEQFGKSTIYFTSENVTFTYSRQNRKWIHELPIENATFDFSNPVINTGHILGNATLILKLLDEFFGICSPYHVRKELIHDQAYINYLIHTGRLSKAGIPYVVSPEYESCVALALKAYSLPEAQQFIGNILTSDSKTYGLLIHQYDRIPALRRDLIEKCPQGEVPVTDFIRPQ